MSFYCHAFHCLRSILIWSDWLPIPKNVLISLSWMYEPVKHVTAWFSKQPIQTALLLINAPQDTSLSFCITFLPIQIGSKLCNRVFQLMRWAQYATFHNSVPRHSLLLNCCNTWNHSFHVICDIRSLAALIQSMKNPQRKWHVSDIWSSISITHRHSN